MLAVCINIIHLSSFLFAFVAHSWHIPGAHFHHTSNRCSSYPYDKIWPNAYFFHNYSIAFDVEAAHIPHSPEDNILLRLTSTVVIAPGGGSGLPPVYKQFSIIFSKIINES